MSRASRLLIVSALASVAAGCGKPENDGYTQSADLGGQPTEVKTPPPPLPAWAGSVMGQPLSSVVKGAVTCKGFIDTVIKHTGAHRGTVIEGWAWDVKDAKPLARVVLTDTANKVIGAGDFSILRPDVPRAAPQVKSPHVGFSSVVPATAGIVTAIGLSDTGASCVLASRTL